MRDQVRKEVDGGHIPRCKRCQGLVKPDIVFFGEGLPKRFADLHAADMQAADALLVIGTSLQVWSLLTSALLYAKLD